MDQFAKKATKIAKAMYQAARDPDQYQPGTQQSPQQHSIAQSQTHYIPPGQPINQQYTVAPPTSYASPSYIPQASQTPAYAHARPTTSTGTLISPTASGSGAHDTLPPPLPSTQTQSQWTGATTGTQSVAVGSAWSSSPAPSAHAATPMSIAHGQSPQQLNSQGYFPEHGTPVLNSSPFTGGFPLPAVNQGTVSLPPIGAHTSQSQAQMSYSSPISNQDAGGLSSSALQHPQNQSHMYTVASPASQSGMFYTSTPHLNSQAGGHFNANATPPFPGSVPPPPPYSHGPPKPIGQSTFVAELPADSLIELSADSVHRHSIQSQSSSPEVYRAVPIQGADRTDRAKPASTSAPHHPKHTSAQAYSHPPEFLGPASPQPLLTATAEASLQKLEQPKPVHPEQTAKATAEQIASITPISPVPSSAQLPPQNSISAMLAGKPRTPPLPGPPPMGPPPLSAPLQAHPAQYVQQYSNPYQAPIPMAQQLAHQQLHHQPYPQTSIHQQYSLSHSQPQPQPPLQHAPQYQYVSHAAALPPPPLPARDQYGNVLPPVQQILPPVYNVQSNPHPSHQQPYQ